LITFETPKGGANLQFIPVYGLSVGILYYDPTLEPSVDEVAEEDFYRQITIMFLVFAIHLTLWKN
jgi:hypothetical protein